MCESRLHGLLMDHLADNSVGYSLFSPPFASLYTYSASPYYMGNCRSKTDGLRSRANANPTPIYISHSSSLFTWQLTSNPSVIGKGRVADKD